ncbi:uncharacterized protein B0J16DRAFT_373997 [Fusarium flagelliforme]|uniref:uncharacterized protein n=1 Tax=Fusarium flagelliforme TaxID=2675880 RepID=UPI001E8CDB9F|nr:uncharacterized protein B0J16DRAFT_373997 [Fusarium flagelliforme]KAH7183569.1 hypothetical protein B0J16DRAFT_373997 [Fusarium flagelliforme]
MRSGVIFFAIGLFVADSALAGPCKPRTSASEEVTATSAATSETATTVLKSSTEIMSDATTTVFTDITSATTVAVDTTLTTSEAEASIAIDSTITVDTTTTAGTTTVADTTTIADTTTTASGAIATAYSFRVIRGPIDGAAPQSDGGTGSSIVFNPNFNGAHATTYTIESDTGRLQDAETGRYICAYYGKSHTPSDPAAVANCFYDGYNGDDLLYNYLTCEIAGGLVSCTAPRGYCSSDENSREVCTTASGVYDQFYYKFNPGGGDLWYIGSASDNPAGYTAINVAATKS